MKLSKALCLGIAIVMLATVAHARGGKSGGGKGRYGGGYYSYYPNTYAPTNIHPEQTYNTTQISEMIRNGQADAIREVTKRVAKNGNPIAGVAYLGTLPGFKQEVFFARAWMKKTDIEILNKLTPGAFEAGMAEFNKPLNAIKRKFTPCCW